MKKTLIVAAAVLLGTATFAGAAEKGTSTSGQQMQNSTTKGASEYSHSKHMHNKGTTGMSRGSSKGTSSSSSGQMNQQKKY